MPVSTSSSTCCAPEDAGCFGEQSEKARLTDPKGMFLTPEELSVDPGTKCTFQVWECNNTLIKDGNCDQINIHSHCTFDEGDCCVDLLIGNGKCDDINNFFSCGIYTYPEFLGVE